MVGWHQTGAGGRLGVRIRSAVKRQIVCPRTITSKCGWTALGVALAVGLRWMLDRGQTGFPFATFSPVILLCAIFLDWRFAILSAAASALLVKLLFVPMAAPSVLFVLSYILTIAILVVAGEVMRQVVRENEAHANSAEVFNTELQHRTKNALQMMRALASRAARATDPAEFYATLSGRLDALARSNELLRFGALPSCEMGELVDAVLKPFRPGRIASQGATCRVDKDAVTPLMMALHELCTNASKYGALSVDGGHVVIGWSGPRQGRIRLEWQEHGGPPVRPPTQRGIGSRLLQAHGGLERVDVDYLHEGVRCRIVVTAAE